MLKTFGFECAHTSQTSRSAACGLTAALRSQHGGENMAWLRWWWMAPATWWQCWLPQSGAPGGILLSIILFVLVIGLLALLD